MNNCWYDWPVDGYGKYEMRDQLGSSEFVVLESSESEKAGYLKLRNLCTGDYLYISAVTTRMFRKVS